METVVMVGRRVCGTRPETAQEIIRQSRAAYRRFETEMEALSQDIKRAHDADAAYRELTREGVR